MEEIKTLYDEAKSAAAKVKKLTKLADSGKFVVSCTIVWIKFHDALHNINAETSVMPKDIAEKLRLTK